MDYCEVASKHSNTVSDPPDWLTVSPVPSSPASVAVNALLCWMPVHVAPFGKVMVVSGLLQITPSNWQL